MEEGASAQSWPRAEELAEQPGVKVDSSFFYTVEQSCQVWEGLIALLISDSRAATAGQQG